MRLRVICVAALATMLLAAGTAQAGPGDVGMPAADFTLNAVTLIDGITPGVGDSYTLSDYLGKVVMLFVVGYG